MAGFGIWLPSGAGIYHITTRKALGTILVDGLVSPAEAEKYGVTGVGSDGSNRDVVQLIYVSESQAEYADNVLIAMDSIFGDLLREQGRLVCLRISDDIMDMDCFVSPSSVAWRCRDQGISKYMSHFECWSLETISPSMISFSHYIEADT